MWGNWAKRKKLGRSRRRAPGEEGGGGGGGGGGIVSYVGVLGKKEAVEAVPAAALQKAISSEINYFCDSRSNKGFGELLLAAQ